MYQIRNKALQGKFGIEDNNVPQTEQDDNNTNIVIRHQINMQLKVNNLQSLIGAYNWN